MMEKRLSHTEKSRHWLKLPMELRNELVEGMDASSGWIQLTVHYNKKTKMVTLDRENRIRLGSALFNELRIDEPENVVVLLEKVETGQLRIARKR